MEKMTDEEAVIRAAPEIINHAKRQRLCQELGHLLIVAVGAVGGTVAPAANTYENLHALPIPKDSPNMSLKSL